MSGDLSKDAGEGADLEEIMGGDRDVVFAAGMGRQTEMTSGLASDPISEFGERLRELRSRNIAREPWCHIAMTSSRT